MIEKRRVTWRHFATDDLPPRLAEADLGEVVLDALSRLLQRDAHVAVRLTFRQIKRRKRNGGSGLASY